MKNKTKINPSIPPETTEIELDQDKFKAIWKGNKKTLSQLNPNKKYLLTHKDQWIYIKTTKNNAIEIIIAHYKPY